MVVHACNPSTQEAEAGELNSRPGWTTQGDPVTKKKKKHIITIFCKEMKKEKALSNLELSTCQASFHIHQKCCSLSPTLDATEC
jgi:hypothetical protein